MTAGVFGKLPGFPDFVHRGLPVGFVDPFAEWLESCLHAARAAIGEGWETAYLAAPVWCFALDPEVVGESGWAGVLATSVDSVGRYYPVVVAFSLAEGVSAALAAETLQTRLRHVEELALGLVDGSRTPEAVVEEVTPFAKALAGIAAPPLVFRNRYGAEVGTVILHPAYPPLGELRGLRGGAPGAGFRGSARASVWWHYGWPDRCPEAVRTRGLPEPDAFAAFIDGAWSDHGWTGPGEARARE